MPERYYHVTVLYIKKHSDLLFDLPIKRSNFKIFNDYHIFSHSFNCYGKEIESLFLTFSKWAELFLHSFFTLFALICTFLSWLKWICPNRYSTVLPLLQILFKLELRQHKNNSIWSKDNLVLKLPRFFTRLYGEWKSGTIS